MPTATETSHRDRQRRRVLGRQPRCALPARARRQARRPDARVPRRADAGDPEPPEGEGPGGRLRHRLPRPARTAGADPPGPAGAEDRDQRRRPESALPARPGAARSSRAQAWGACRSASSRATTSWPGSEMARRRHRARPPGDGRADHGRGRSAPECQRLPRCPADRRGARGREPPRGDRPGGRRVADPRPGGGPPRLVVGRLGPPGGGERRRPPHRVRCPGDRRPLARVGEDSPTWPASAIRSPRSPTTARA